VLSLLAANVAYALRNFFIPKRYMDRTVKEMFVQPYPRIFMQQFVTIITGFALIAFDAPTVAVLVLILIRFCFDLCIQAAVKSAAFKVKLAAIFASNGSAGALKEAEVKVNMFIDG